MPELPEIKSRAREMKHELVGKTITGFEIKQPKNLNIAKKAFVRALTGAQVLNVNNHGKWIITETSGGWLLINLGMGGEILLVSRANLPKKWRMIIDFNNGACLAINFWWFGYVHFAPVGELNSHAMTAKLGLNADELTAEGLQTMLKGRRGNIKSFLLDQSNIAGIGNAYIHDILFMARLHPLRSIDTLTVEEINGLAEATHKGLQTSIDKGGAFYEMNIYGKPGGFKMEDIQIGYREGKPCPICGTAIEKIKTGSTSSFVCSNCQRLT
jgi:formamidopyrimidine-DNA glycosylase